MHYDFPENPVEIIWGVRNYLFSYTHCYNGETTHSVDGWFVWSLKTDQNVYLSFFATWLFDIRPEWQGLTSAWFGIFFMTRYMKLEIIRALLVVWDGWKTGSVISSRGIGRYNFSIWKKSSTVCLEWESCRPRVIVDLFLRLPIAYFHSDKNSQKLYNFPKLLPGLGIVLGHSLCNIIYTRICCVWSECERR